MTEFSVNYSFNKHMSQERVILKVWSPWTCRVVYFHGLVMEAFEEMKTETSCQMCFELFLLIPSGGCLGTSLFFKNEEMRSSVLLYFIVACLAL